MQGLNIIYDDEASFFPSTSVPCSFQSRWYELPLCIYRDLGDLSLALARGEDHDARDAILICKETICEDLLVFGDPSTAERMLTKHELKISGRAAAVQTGHIAKVSCIDAHEDEPRKWISCQCSIRKARVKAS